MPLLLPLLILIQCLMADSGFGVEVKGRLQNNLGNGISNISVRAFWSGSTNFAQSQINSDMEGRFTFSGEAGTWQVFADDEQLNERGYFSAPGSLVTVSNQTGMVRLTTRKLDLSHHLLVGVVDQDGQPITDYNYYSLSASIMENGQTFKTNVSLPPMGAAVLAVSPAVWRIALQGSPWGSQRVLPELDIEVPETNTEVQAALIAPSRTATISGTTSNLSGWDIVAQSEAYGTIYRFTRSVFSLPPPFESSFESFSFPVFNGTWTLFATNDRSYLPAPFLAPQAITVVVTNGDLQVRFEGLPLPNLRVRTLSVGGEAITNAMVWASKDEPFFGPYATPSGEGTFNLPVEPGRWRASASTMGSIDNPGWQITHAITISSNESLWQLDLLFPDQESGPRISGKVADAEGVGRAGQSVTLAGTDNGTNYSASVTTDSEGNFEARVLPGRWQIAARAGACQNSTNISVSTSDASVALTLWQGPGTAPVPVRVEVLDEAGLPAPGNQISLWSAFDSYYTQISPPDFISVPLHPGLWQASSSSYMSDPYKFGVEFEWYLPPVPATNFILIEPRAPARIEGRLRDEQGRLLLTGFADARANVDGTNYTAHSSISSGYFSLNVFPGEWEVTASPLDYWSQFQQGISSTYHDPPPQLVRVTGDVARVEFAVGQRLTNVFLTVSAVLENGDPVNGAYIVLSAGNVSIWRSLNEGGEAQFTATPGPCRIDAFSGFGDILFEYVLWPSLSIEVSAPTNHFTLVFRTPASYIKGKISDTSATAGRIPIYASTQINGTNYSSGACPDRDGQFCIPVFPGFWDVSFSDWFVNGFGLRSVPAQEVLVTDSGEPPHLHFVLSPIAGDYREALFGPPTVLADGTLRLELHGQTALTWQIERSEDLLQWTPLTTATMLQGVLSVSDAAPFQDSVFYRSRWVK